MKFLKIFALIFVLLVIITFLFIQINSRDIAVVNDADLILAPVPILPEADNAYYVLEELRTQNDVDDLIATNAFIAASQMAGYQCPTKVNNHVFEAEECVFSDLRDLALLTATRATSSLAAGDIADAMMSSVAIMQMAHLFAESNGNVMEQLFAITMYDIGLVTLSTVVESPQLSLANRSQIATVLLAAQPDRTNLHDAYRSEYMKQKDIIYRITTGDTVAFPGGGEGYEQNNYFWHPNRTTQLMADLYSYSITGKDSSGVLIRPQQLQQYVEELLEWGTSPLDRISPNAQGMRYLALVAASFNDQSEQVKEIEEQYQQLHERLK